jgi:hypothetical protein
LQPGKEPPYRPLYPLSPRELATLKEFLEENLKRGFIRESKSPAGTPILLPLITEIMDRVTRASCFSKIDLKDAYYRPRIEPGDEWKQPFGPAMDTMKF